MSKNYLILNTYGIGDVMFSTPLLESIKAYQPDARIVYLCNRRTQEILDDHPQVDRVLVYEKDEFVKEKQRSFSGWLKKWKILLDQIREEGCDTAIDLSLSSKIGLIPVLAGIKKRVGLNYKNRGRYLTHKIDIHGFEGKHVAEFYLDVIRIMGIPVAGSGLTLGISEARREWSDGFLKTHGINASDFLVGIAPCGGQTLNDRAHIKQWPAQHFVALIDWLQNEYQAQVLLFGAPHEKKQIDEICSTVNQPQRCLAVCDASLMQCAALIDHCRLFIGNDTGLLRFADALKKKTVGIFGPVDERVYGMFPFDPQTQAYLTADVMCRPCYHRFRFAECRNQYRCIKDISVTTAVKHLEIISKI